MSQGGGDRSGVQEDLMRLWRRLRPVEEAALFRLGLALVPLLPRRSVVALAAAAGSLAYRCARRDRRIALANLDLAYGAGLAPSEKVAIARRSFITFALVLLDYFWFSRRTAERLRRHVRIDASLGRWLHAGPLMAVTAHFGNWEMLGLSTALQGTALASVARPLRNQRIDGHLQRFRQSTGQRVVPREGALKVLVNVLREGGTVALLLDQDTPLSEGGVFVDFFGVPVPVSGAAAALARRMGAPILPVFCKVQRGGDYLCYARAPIPVETLEQLSPEAITGRIAALLEAEIRADPGQWLWMYKRWKRRHPGCDPARYPFYADS